MMIYYWSNKIQMKYVREMTNLSKNTIIKMYQKLRQVCRNDLQRNPIRVGGGGQNFVVQVDESMIRHGQRGGRGRRANPVWVFGLADTQFQPAKGYMEVVPRRDRATLTGAINRVLLPNTVITSDEWRGYLRLPQFVQNCIRHDSVNHTYNFVNPANGAHTQNIESYWNKFKLVIKAMKGIELQYLQSYMDEFMWRDWRGLEEPLENIINCINIDYP
ncbi:uncharacterized protein [Clytia hemisphaerica]|uniref:ISXO2-like transposase domain-containing protein n=2 Tax=Clytia hemisphaerica TaxID=252671 RepID=A0A7M5XGM4_9CNID